ncbi:MAG: MG2 domain-containing protein, partial [bacterium]
IALNRKQLVPVYLDPTLRGKSKKGILFLNLSREIFSDCIQPPRINTETAMVQVTDIGLFVKKSWDNTIIWTTRISTGEPLSDVKLTIRNHFNDEVWTGSTNKNGIAVAPGQGELFPPSRMEDDHGTEIYIIAEKKGDRAFLSTGWGDDGYYDKWSGSGWYHGEKKTSGEVFTERGVYRPGEKVYFKGIIRWDKFARFTTPSGEKVTYTVKDPEGKELAQKTVKLNKFGSFAAEIRVPANARPGYYGISMNLKGAENSHRRQFRVEEYRAPEFEVKVSADKKEYIFGDTIRSTVEGKYLFGAPMKREKVEWTVRQSRTWYEPPKHDEYIFNDDVWQPGKYDSDEVSDAVLVEKKTTLDAAGMFKASVKTQQGAKVGSKNYTLEAVVIDANRQAVAESRTVLVHQGEFYIGLKRSNWFIKAGEMLKVGVISVKPDGTVVSGKSVKLQLYRREWHTVLKEHLYDDWHYESKPVDTLITSCSVQTGGKTPDECSFHIKTSGSYYVRARASDSRGNTIIASFDIYAIGEDYVSWERTDSTTIELVKDKELYKPGDNAKILVKSPYQKAKALLTIEREKIFSWKVIDLVGTAPTIEVPVKKDFVTNFGVSLTVIQGRTSEELNSKGKDTGKPSYRTASTGISIDTSMHRMLVSVQSDKKDYRPGDTVRLKVKTQTSAGKNTSAEVAVMVVDEGVLNLTGYRPPDLMNSFYYGRGNSVGNSNSYMHIIARENYGKKGRNPGGSGKGGGYNIVPRSVFAASAYWNPSVITDKNGAAEVSFKLPDNLTKYIIMATANTARADFGYAENAFRVNKPLMIRPALPRFALLGDTFSAGAVLHNYDKNKQKVVIKISAEGITLQDTKPKSLYLSPAKAQEIRFNFKADKLGTAKITFTAVMGAETDAVVASFPVKAPKPTEAVAAYGVTLDETRQKIQAPKSVHKDAGGLTVTIASTALAGLEQGVKQLVEYPYGCLEQTVSRALPLVLLEDLITHLRIPGLKIKEINKIVNKTLDKLPLFQKGNGGMAFWENLYGADPYLSAYTLLFLNEAERAKYKIDKNLRGRLVKYLETSVRNQGYCSIGSCSSMYVFILFALADAGNAMPQYYEQLYNLRGDLSLSRRALLAMIMHKSGGFEKMADELLRDLKNHAVMSGATAHFEETWQRHDMSTAMFTGTYTNGVILMSLVSADPDNPLIPKIVTWLLRSRVDGRWENTHAASFALMSLSKYYKRFEAEPPNFKADVKLGKRSFLKSKFKGTTTRIEKKEVPMSEVLKTGDTFLSLSKSGKGMLFYSVLMSYLPLKRDVQPLDEGFVVITDYYRFGEQKKLEAFKAGDAVKVRITVIAPIARNYVVVEDQIPAGFEIVNQTFRTSPRYTMSYEDYCDYEYCEDEGETEKQKLSADFMNWWVFNKIELYDDRIVLFADQMQAGMYTYSFIVHATTSGTFFDPATKAEEMYAPDIFGRNHSRLIKIK